MVSMLRISAHERQVKYFKEEAVMLYFEVITLVDWKTYRGYREWMKRNQDMIVFI